MAIVKPFKGLRTPNQQICEELACLPYDVMNSEEAAQMAAGKPKSLLHVTRAEIDCPAGTDIHSGWCRTRKLSFIFTHRRWTAVLNMVLSDVRLVKTT